MANASALDAPFEALFDRTAALSPDVTEFTSPGGTTDYPIPALTKWLEILLIGGGGRGGNCPGGDYHGGAGGGGAGELLHRWVRVGPLFLPEATTLSVHVGAGATQGGPATSSYILDAAGRNDAPFRLYARWGDNGAPGGATEGGSGGERATTGGSGYGSGSAAGGAGAGSGAGVGGGDGETGYFSKIAAGGDGGINGTPTSPGQGGRPGHGYGAGGGGAGGSGFSFSNGPGGGGGGGGGYGVATLAVIGAPGPGIVDSAKYGGNGAPGIVIITAWRGAP